MASPEFSFKDVAEKAVRVLLFALGIDLGTSCSFRPFPGLSARDVDRAAEVGGRRFLVLCTRGARGRDLGSSHLVLSPVLSPVLSVGDVGEDVVGDMVLTPSLVAGRAGGSVWGIVSTVHSLTMSPELPVGDMGKATVGARLTPELSIGGVERCALQDKVPSTRLPS